MKNTLKTQWNAYTSARAKRLFPDQEEYQPCNRQDSLEQIKDYIHRSISDSIERNLGFPIVTNFSSEGMSEFEKLTYLIEKTGDMLGHAHFANIIYDEYRIEDGTEGIYDILQTYIKWIDTSQ